MIKHQMFMAVAHVFASQSTCNRGSIGAVIVRDRRIISTGYVGSPPGQPHCTEVGCEPVPVPYGTISVTPDIRLKQWGCQRTIHAEANAILWAARAGIATEGATMYCTSSPCVKCAHAIIASGIVEVIFDKEYRVPTGIRLLIDSGVLVRQIDEELHRA